MKEAAARTPAPAQRGAETARRPPAAAPSPRVAEPATARDPTGPSLLDHLRGASLAQRWQAATGDPVVPLPGRAALERRFSSSLARVRVHHGPAARSLLDYLGARGAAAGNVVLLRDPLSDAATVAHEVAHVLQSAGDGPVGAPLAADHPAEREAEALARRPGPGRVRVRLGPGVLALRRNVLPVRDPDADLAEVALAAEEAAEPGRPPPEGEPAPAAEEVPAPEEAPAPEVPAVPEETTLPPEAAVEVAHGPEATPTAAEPAGPTAAEAAVAPAGPAPDRQAELREVIGQTQQTWDDGAGTAAAHEVEPCPEAATAPGMLPFARGPPPEAPPAQERLPEPASPELEEPDPTPLDEARQNVRERLEQAPARAPPAGTSELDGEQRQEREANRRDLSRQVETATAEPAPPGPSPPTVGGQGDADPERATEAAEAFAVRAEADRETARDATAEDFGEDRLAPERDPTAEHDRQLEGLEVPGVNLAAEVDQSRLALVATDANAGQVPIEQVVLVQDGELAVLRQTADAQGQTRQQVDDAIATSQQTLDRSCQEAGGARDTLVAEAGAGVATQRDRWTTETDQLVDRRAGEAEELRQGTLAEVERLEQDANASAEQTVTKARDEAGELWRETRERAEAKATESADPSWFEQGIDWVRERVAALAEWIDGFVETCRRTIDTLLDAAAAVAHAIVAMAQRAIAATLDTLRAGLDLIADNLPGELGELARAHRDTIHRLLDLAQAGLDAWAEELHLGIDQGIATFQDALHQTLDALQAGVRGVAAAIDSLLDNGLMAFLRGQFPELADLVDQGLLAPVELAAGQLGAWISGVMEATGLAKLDRMASQLQADRLCAVPTTQEQAEDCEAFRVQLQGAIGMVDAMLASPVAKNLQEVLRSSQTERAGEQLDAVDNFFGFIRARAPPVLEWWQRVRPDVERALGQLGDTAATIWGHIAVALGLDPNLPPLEALQQELERHWAVVSGAVGSLVQSLRDAWAWLRDESVLAFFFDLVDGVRSLWNSLNSLWEQTKQGAMDWLASAAGTLRALLPTVDDAMNAASAVLHPAIDEVDRWGGGLLDLVDTVLHWKSGVALVDAVLGLLEALTTPTRLALRAFRGCLLAAWRWLADDLRNLGRLVRTFADVAVGLFLALATAPIGLVAFFAGNVWLHLLPDCYKPPILNFLLDVAIRFVQFLPEPADLQFAILHQGLLAFLQGLRAAPDDQKVAAVNLLASIVAGDVMVAAGFALGLVEGIWESTGGTLLFLLQATGWLITLPVRLGSWATGMISGALTGGAEEPEVDVPEAEPEAPVPAAEGSELEEMVEEPTAEEPTAEELTGDPAADQPPIPAALSDLGGALRSLVSGGFTRQDIQQVLDAGRAMLRAVVGVLARKAAAALLSALSAPEAAGAGFAVARTVGWLVGQLLVEVVLAALTYGASTTIVAAKAAIQGARVTARFGGAIRRVRTTLDPLLDVVKQLKKALDGVVKAIRKWIDDVLEWMRHLARRFFRRFTRKRGKHDKRNLQEKEGMLGITFHELFQAGGEQHEIYSKKGKPQNLYIASKSPQSPAEAVSDSAVKKDVKELDDEFKTKMTGYHDLRMEMTGTSSDNALIRKANKLWREAEEILMEIVKLVKKEKDGPGRHAPHIGNPAPHGQQQDRLRRLGKLEIKAWRLESEHLIPRALISAYFSVLPLSKPVSNIEYERMVTILMYENASNEKTNAAKVGDQASIRKMQALTRDKLQTLREGDPIPAGLLEKIRAEVQVEFEERSFDSLSRAAAAVVDEQQAIGDARGKGAQALPTRTQLADAYEAQEGQVDDFREERARAAAQSSADMQSSAGIWKFLLLTPLG